MKDTPPPQTEQKIELCYKSLHEMTPENTYIRPNDTYKVCRACKRVRQNAYKRRQRDINHEKIIQQERAYRARHPQTRKQYNGMQRSIAKDNIENPEKHIARNLLRNAVKRGEVVKPKNCEECGAEALLHGHHEDYDKPLDVSWLCHMCHGRLHRLKRRESELKRLGE